MKDFRQLAVGQKSHELTLLVYESTASFPREEVYGLTAQMRRAASSIPSQYCRRLWRRWRCGTGSLLPYCPSFGQRVGIPRVTGSGFEILDVGTLRAMTERVVEVKRMLTGLIQKLAADR